jgi:hypothetical protein
VRRSSRRPTTQSSPRSHRRRPPTTEAPPRRRFLPLFGDLPLRLEPVSNSVMWRSPFHPPTPTGSHRSTPWLPRRPPLSRHVAPSVSAALSAAVALWWRRVLETMSGGCAVSPWTSPWSRAPGCGPTGPPPAAPYLRKPPEPGKPRARSGRAGAAPHGPAQSPLGPVGYAACSYAAGPCLVGLAPRAGPPLRESAQCAESKFQFLFYFRNDLNLVQTSKIHSKFIPSPKIIKPVPLFF